jgi:hypothetical protein
MEDAVGGTCSTHGRYGKRFLSENMKGRDHLREVGLNAKIMRRMFKKFV